MYQKPNRSGTRIPTAYISVTDNLSEIIPYLITNSPGPSQKYSCIAVIISM